MAAVADIQEHRARCAPHLAWLRAIAGGVAGDHLPPGLADEIGQVTGLILAEAREAGLATVAAFTGSPRNHAVAAFLAARLERLATAAGQAVAAAKDQDASALRQHLHRFEAMSSAFWTVQLGVDTQSALIPPAPSGPAGRSSHAAR